MPKLLIFPMLFVLAAHSQSSTIKFKLNMPKKGISNALYNHIIYLDSRTDSTGMGIVQSGSMFSKNAEVVFAEPMSTQLEDVVSQLTAKSTGTDTGLFQLRNLKFYQRPGYFSNKGYCLLKANFYAVKNGKYFLLNYIDTLITVKTMTMDGHPTLFAGGKAITSFITQNLTSPTQNDSSFEFSTLVHIDDFEKQQLPLYAKDTFTNGIYTSWESFKNQQPDFANKLSATLKDGKIETVAYADSNNVIYKSPPAEIYAVVYEQQAYIAAKSGFYALKKEGNELIFISKERDYVGSAETFAARQLMGPFSFLYEMNQKGTYAIKIDHANGQFTRVKKVE